MGVSSGLYLLAFATCLVVANGGTINLNRRLATPHIVNGVDTTIEKVPYQITIESYRYPSCGGAILSENWAITAAHCVHPDSAGSLLFKRIVAGVTYEFIFSWGGYVHQIEKMIYHPDYASTSLDYDVAVLKVSNKFEFGERVQPISIPIAEEDEVIAYNGVATVSGWGRLDTGSWWHPLHLQSVDIPLVHRQICQRIYDYYSISPRMICGAGDGKGGPCMGDSGGPMVQRNQLIGLVSWGKSCNDPKYPTIFTNLLDYEIRSFVKSFTSV